MRCFASRARLQNLLIVIALISASGSRLSANDKNADRIRPYTKNPHYWQYEGTPVLLLGGSKTDHIFLLDDLKAHLDEIAAAGADYVRCTMSQREGLDLKPHKRLPNGKFDLTRWNDDYWKRFANCLKWCKERDIIIQIEVWDRFDYTDSRGINLWQISPWRPANNINYTAEQSGFADRYRDHPSRDKQPFFHTVPGMKQYQKKYDVIRRFQEQFVEKMLSYSLPYGNVLYCMNNETSTDARWGQYWMQFIRDHAAAAGVEVYTTDMFDDAFKPRKSEKLKLAIDNPKLYPFLDISQVNSRNFNEDHWNALSWIMRQAAKYPRPVNHTKIYSAGQKSFGTGTPVDGVERFWRNLIAGSASCRFHRPDAGIGLNEIAKACIGAARKIETLVKFWNVKPRLDLLKKRETDEAYLAARLGKEYILYFTDGGQVELDLTKQPGRFKLRWVNIATNEWGTESTLAGGRSVPISAPGSRGWVAAIVRQ